MKTLGRQVALKENRIESYFYENYDELIHQLCPDYREMIGNVASAVPWHANEVVDLGCGTGTLLAAIAASRGAISRLTGIDLNPALLAVARRKLEHLPAGAVALVESDFIKTPLPAADVYVSSLVLHNLGVVAQMLVYRKIAQIAQRFVQFEVVSGDDAVEEAQRWDYLDFGMENQGIPKTERTLAIDHMRAHDRPLTVTQHRQICLSVGFTEFTILNSSPGFVVFRADRHD